MRIAALMLALFVLLGCSSPATSPTDGQGAAPPAAPEGTAAPPGEAQAPGFSGGVDKGAGPSDGSQATAPERDWEEQARQGGRAAGRVAPGAQSSRLRAHACARRSPPPDAVAGDRLVSIAYVDDDLNRVLRVSSGPLGCCIDADPNKMVAGGTPIRDGREARFIPNQPEFGGNILWWQEDGAYVALSGPHLTEEDLFAIAEFLSPTATLTGPPDAPPPDVYPPDYRTEVPQVDAVIDAFLAKDVHRLASCDMLRCEEGAEGALEPVVTRGSCEVNNTWTGWDTVRSLVEGWVGEPRLLDAAYRVQGIGDWAYLVQFAKYRHDQRPKSAVLDGEGRILQLWMGCGALFDMQADHYEPIAPPRTGL